MRILSVLVTSFFLFSCNQNKEKNATKYQIVNVDTVESELKSLLPVATDFKTDLKKLEKRIENCISEGTPYKYCAENYEFQLDSMLTVVTKNILNKLPDSAKVTFQKNENQWIKAREKEFKEIEAGYNAVGGEKDVYYQDRSDFLFKRLKSLIEKY